MGCLETDLTFVTWDTRDRDREDPSYFTPSVLEMEANLKRSGAVSIDSLVDFVTTKYRPDGDRIQYIDIGSIDLQTGAIRAEVLPSDEAPSRARFVVSTGDILVSSVRPGRGTIGKVPGSLDGAIASSGFFVLRPNDLSPVSSDALYLYLLTDIFRVQAVRRAASSMYPVMNQTEFRTILVPAKELARASEGVASLRAAESALARATKEFTAARASVTDLIDF